MIDDEVTRKFMKADFSQFVREDDSFSGGVKESERLGFYTPTGLSHSAYQRALLVIAAGHEDSTRLAQEVLVSRYGVTDEILEAPMWNQTDGKNYLVDGTPAW